MWKLLFVFIVFIFPIKVNTFQAFLENEHIKINKTVYISGHSKNLTDEDTIQLNWRSNFFSTRKQAATPSETILSSVSQGRFQFCIRNSNNPFYFTLTKVSQGRKTILLSYYLAIPGDSIVIGWKGSEMQFTGKGANGFWCQYEINQQDLQLRQYFMSQQVKLKANTFLDFYKNKFSEYDSILQGKLNILSKYRCIDPGLYHLIEADIFGQARYMKSYSYFGAINLYSDITRLFSSPVKRDSIRKELLELYQTSMLLTPHSAIQEEIKATSKNYLNFLLIYAVIDSRVKGIEEPYNYLKKQFRGLLRDKLIVLYFIENFNKMKNSDEMINNALTTVKTDFCHSILKNMYNIQGQGSVAFNFSLPDTANNIIKLKDFYGKVIFLDFWFTGCSGCIHYYKHVLSYIEDQYKGRDDIVFISISIDKDNLQWLKSLKSGKYSSKHAINLYTGGAGADHKIVKHYNISGYPKPLLIDKKGRIFSSNENQLKDRKKIVKLINAALSVRMN